MLQSIDLEDATDMAISEMGCVKDAGTDRWLIMGERFVTKLTKDIVIHGNVDLYDYLVDRFSQGYELSINAQRGVELWGEEKLAINEPRTYRLYRELKEVLERYVSIMADLIWESNSRLASALNHAF